MARFVRAVLATAMLLLTARSAIAQERVLGPGLEQEVSRLVFPGDDPPELAADVQVVGARIQPTHVDVPLAGEGRRGLVRLHAPGVRIEGWPAGETQSFSVWLVEGVDDPTLHRAAEALRARVAARDRGGFFEEHASRVDRARGSSPAAMPDPQRRWVRGALWSAWLVGLVVLALWARRDGALVSRTDSGVALALFASSLVLRLVLPPWAPVHANEHGIAEMRGLTGDPAGHEAWLYGSAYVHAVRAALAPFGRAPDGPFLLASIFGALGPVSLFGLGRALAPDRRAGALLAALALAIHPGHIRLSVSESPKPLVAWLWLMGAALAIWAFRAEVRRPTRDLAFVLSALAWSLALELHVLTLLLPIAGALMVLVAVGERARAPGWPAALLGVVVVGGVAASHLLELEHARSAASERPLDVASMIARSLGPANTLRDPRITPALVLPFALASAIALVSTGKTRWVAAAVIAMAILMPPSILVNACRTDAIRYQSEPQLPLFLLLVGFPFPSRTGARDLALGALAPIALVATAIPGWIDVSIPDVHARAYTIAREHAPPPPTEILIPPPRMREAPKVLADFPDYAIAAPARVTTDASSADCRAWIGVPCWSFTSEELERGTPGVELEPGAPMRRECVELLGGVTRARAALAELIAVEVPHREREFHRIVAPEPRVGYALCPPPR